MENKHTPDLPVQPLNPWFSIWTQPRKTIRQQLDKEPGGFTELLAMTGGIAMALTNGIQASNVNFNALVTSAVLGGSLFGILQLSLASALIRFTGKWLGGTGKYSEIRTALAWSNVPNTWSLILWIPVLFLYEGKFLGGIFRPISSGSITVFIVIIAVITIWTFFIQVKCIAEAQRFSAWRAAVNMILAGLVIAVFLLGFMMLFYYQKP